MNNIASVTSDADRKIKLDSEDNSYEIESNEELFIAIHSFMVAIICAGPFLAVVFDALGFFTGILPVISISSAVISIMSSVILTRFTIFRVNIENLLILIFILICFTLSWLRLSRTLYLSDYFTKFLFYGGTAFLMSCFPVNYKKIIEGISVISIIFFINPFGIVGEIAVDTSNYLAISMGASYSLFPCVCAGLIHFIYYRDSANLLVKLSYVSNAMILYFLIFNASRGILVAFFVLLFSVLFSYQRGYSIFSLIAMAKFSSILVVIAIVTNIENIMLWAYNTLSYLGLEITAISKSVIKMSNGSILNGRDEVYGYALNMIEESPYFGYGISAYAIKYNGTYPHNIILQLLVEFGIFLTIPICIYLLFVTFKALSPLKDNYIYNTHKLFIVFLFTASIPRLFFSSFFWQDQAFWLLVFFYSDFKLLESKMDEEKVIQR